MGRESTGDYEDKHWTIDETAYLEKCIKERPILYDKAFSNEKVKRRKELQALATKLGRSV